MTNAIKRKPINCAVWVNATDTLLKEQAARIGAWRREFYFNYKGPICEFHPAHSIKSVLIDQFAKSALRSSPALKCEGERMDEYKSGIAAMQTFAMTRTTQLIKALNPASLRVRPRAQRCGTVFEKHNFHIDSMNAGIHLRFLDAIDSVGTYLTANDNAVAVQPNVYALKPEGKVDVFEAPAGSLVLITQSHHPHQPILHSEPFNITPGPLTGRTVHAYDLA
jgi:hypothetical protein